jgi:hypothetical protein
MSLKSIVNRVALSVRLCPGVERRHARWIAAEQATASTTLRTKSLSRPSALMFLYGRAWLGFRPEDHANYVEGRERLAVKN